MVSALVKKVLASRTSVEVAICCLYCRFRDEDNPKRCALHGKDIIDLFIEKCDDFVPAPMIVPFSSGNSSSGELKEVNDGKKNK